MTIGVLMPCFNEGARLIAAIAALGDWARTHEAVTLYLVDDGSAVALDARDVAVRAGVNAGALRVVLARHSMNLGQGAALETARCMAALAGAKQHDVVVTMDADGQHDPADLSALLAAVRAGADVAQGERSQSVGIPLRRRLLLAGARLFESLLVGRRVKDAHNGYRAISISALPKLQLRQNRMAHATEIAILCKHAGLRCVDVPVHVRYTQDTLAKGQRATDAVVVVRDLARRYLFARSGSP